MRSPLSATLVLLLASLAPLWLQAQAPPAPDPNQPYVMEYYYKIHWGHQQEFLELFRRNHLPVLNDEISSGRILSVKMETPAFHMPEQERWDYRVTIVFKNAAAAYTPSDEPAIQRRLFPDQAAFKREEQRRFEILEAHWDLALTPIPLAERR